MTRDLVAPTSRTYVSQGLTLHYADWGNDSAPLLVLLHGTRDHARSWDWTAAALKDRWHVIAPDLRGHGDSEWSPDGAYLNPYHFLDFVELMETLAPEKVSLVAHSFGAGIASRYAALYPHKVSKLALVDGFGPSLQTHAMWTDTGPVERTRTWIEQRRSSQNKTTRRFATLDEAAARMAAGNPRLTAEQARHLTLHGVRQDANGYSWKFDPRVSQFTPEDFAIPLTSYWREIKAPTLLCYGTESDQLDPDSDGRSASFADHRTVAVANAGHWPHHDQFDLFIGILQDFLA
jgi:pimeloyl-ACP methyl ester carboxylesterase